MSPRRGIPVAGGHSIDSPEPICGRVAIGLIDPRRVLRDGRAESGDPLLLTKPLGIGIFSAALKKGERGLGLALAELSEI